MIKKIALLQQSDFLKGFGSEDLTYIARHSTIRRYEPEAPVRFDDAHQLLLIVRGRIEDGDGFTYDCCSIIGEQSFYGERRGSAALRARSEVVVLEIPRNRVLDRMSNDASLGVYLLSRKMTFGNGHMSSAASGAAGSEERA